MAASDPWSLNGECGLPLPPLKHGTTSLVLWLRYCGGVCLYAGFTLSLNAWTSGGASNFFIVPIAATRGQWTNFNAYDRLPGVPHFAGIGHFPASGGYKSLDAGVVGIAADGSYDSTSIYSPDANHLQEDKHFLENAVYQNGKFVRWGDTNRSRFGTISWDGYARHTLAGIGHANPAFQWAGFSAYSPYSNGVPYGLTMRYRSDRVAMESLSFFQVGSVWWQSLGLMFSFSGAPTPAVAYWIRLELTDGVSTWFVSGGYYNTTDYLWSPALSAMVRGFYVQWNQPANSSSLWLGAFRLNYIYMDSYGRYTTNCYFVDPSDVSFYHSIARGVSLTITNY